MQQKHSREVLEKYFNDVKALFLKRFGLFDAESSISEIDERRLIELLRELIFIKWKLQDREDDLTKL